MPKTITKSRIVTTERLQTEADVLNLSKIMLHKLDEYVRLRDEPYGDNKNGNYHWGHEKENACQAYLQAKAEWVEAVRRLVLLE